MARTTALAAMLTAAALLLFCRLGAIYLWQDEANTAVLAVRMLKFGKPLAYDGVNLLTNDSFAAEDQQSIDTRASSAAAAVEYVIKRGDVKADTAWIFHPWGQFVAAAVGIKALGPTTIAARLPFAAAALASFVVLYLLVRRHTGNITLATLTCALLLLNPYWILHSRQARYYALSTLCLLLTLLAYERWVSDGRWGAPLFVTAAWLWFQVDYGTWWPVLGVLFTHALIVNWTRPWRVLASGAMLTATVVPFLFFYELWGRRSAQVGAWSDRFAETVFNVDRFVISMIVLAAVLSVLVWGRTRVASSERRLVAISAALLCALLFWVPTVAPVSFLRYVIIAAPLGAVVIAWFLYRVLASWPRPVAWLAGAMLVLTPWLNRPFDALAAVPEFRAGHAVIRPELEMMFREIFVPRPDPNAAVVEWLRRNASPADEILINYEDLPLMYYLANPVRGGVAAFRVEDPVNPPAFAVLRRSVAFVHWPVFAREIDRYRWDKVSIGAPDVTWGNNPDPYGQVPVPGPVPELLIARRVGTRIP